MFSTRSQFICLWFCAGLALLSSLDVARAQAAKPLAAQPAQPAAVQPAPAPQPVPPPPNYSPAAREMGLDVNAKMGEWGGELDRIDKELDSKTLRYRDLDRNRDRLEQLRNDMDGFLDGLRPKVDAFRAQVEGLGPGPGKDQPPEPEAVAQQRNDWNATLGSLTVAQKAAEAARLRAGQITCRLAFYLAPDFPRGPDGVPKDSEVEAILDGVAA